MKVEVAVAARTGLRVEGIQDHIDRKFFVFQHPTALRRPGKFLVETVSFITKERGGEGKGSGSGRGRRYSELRDLPLNFSAATLLFLFLSGWYCKAPFLQSVASVNIQTRELGASEKPAPIKPKGTNSPIGLLYFIRVGIRLDTQGIVQFRLFNHGGSVERLTRIVRWSLFRSCSELLWMDSEEVVIV